MKRSQWIVGIGMTVLCLMAVLTGPVKAEAASQSERNAYRAVFDASYYYCANPDVAEACGMDAEALFNHFVTYGVSEGRNGCADFNPQAYRQRYEDLEDAFGNDMAAYCRHYVTYGRSEGRDAHADGQESVEVNVTVRQREAKTEESAEMEEDADESEAEEDTAEVAANRISVSESSVEPAVIGTYTTYYNADIPRAVNVELAAERIDGVIVQPGEGFSFSGTILARTRANGYVEAPIFVRGQESTGIGGGVCQVSSTLYAAMLDAELPATERHPHSRRVDYLPKGMDATIAGNYLDLKFTNTFSQPLMIQATAENGELVVSLSLQ